MGRNTPPPGLPRYTTQVATLPDVMTDLMEPWALWVLAGIALMLVELFLSTFFILWFGLGGVLVGLLSLVFSGLQLRDQLLLWSVLSVGMAAGWFFLLRPRRPKVKNPVPRDHFAGETGLVIQAVEPFSRGLVQFQKPILGDDKWQALADDPIAAGSRVQVTQVEGNLIRVRPV